MPGPPKQHTGKHVSGKHDSFTLTFSSLLVLPLYYLVCVSLCTLAVCTCHISICMYTYIYIYNVYNYMDEDVDLPVVTSLQKGHSHQ